MLTIFSFADIYAISWVYLIFSCPFILLIKVIALIFHCLVMKLKFVNCRYFQKMSPFSSHSYSKKSIWKKFHHNIINGWFLAKIQYFPFPSIIKNSKNMKKCLRSHKLWQDKNYSSKPVLNKIGAKIGTLQKTSTFYCLNKGTSISQMMYFSSPKNV